MGFSLEVACAFAIGLQMKEHLPQPVWDFVVQYDGWAFQR